MFGNLKQILFLSVLVLLLSCSSSEDRLTVNLYLPFNTIHADSIIINQFKSDNINCVLNSSFPTRDIFDSSQTDEIPIFITDEISAAQFITENNVNILGNIADFIPKRDGRFYAFSIFNNPVFLYSNEGLTGSDSIKNLQGLFEFSQNFQRLDGKYPFGICYGDKWNIYDKVINYMNMNDIGAGFPKLFSDYNYNDILKYSELSSYCLIETERYIRNNFINNKLAYCIDDISLNQKLMKSGTKFKYKVEIIPWNEGAIFARIYYLIFRDSKKSDSKAILDLIYGDEFMRNISENHPELGLPANKSMYIQINKIIQAGESDYKIYSIPINEITQNYVRIIEGMSDKIVLSEESPWQALKDADLEMKRLTNTSRGELNAKKQHN